MKAHRMWLMAAAGLLSFGQGVHAQNPQELPTVVVTQPKPKAKPARAQPRHPREANREPQPAAPARPAPTPQAAPAQPDGTASPTPAPEPGPRYDQPVTTALQGTPTTAQQTSTGPATIVTRDQLARSSAAQLSDTLFTRPGVTSTTYAPGASFPIIRGLDSLRVRIQENGVGAQDATDLGQDHGVPIDPLASAKVEIIRGPGTLRYSSQAIGGAVVAFRHSHVRRGRHEFARRRSAQQRLLRKGRGRAARS